MSQSDTELREAIASILNTTQPKPMPEIVELPSQRVLRERHAMTVEQLVKDLSILFTQAKNELLQELLEQKKPLYETAVESPSGETIIKKREYVPVQVIEKYLAKGDGDE